jgi:hypothetical protein
MGDKADYQHGGSADGKTFKATAPISSPEFGVAQQDREAARGMVPGSAQWEPASPDPETP